MFDYLLHMCVYFCCVCFVIVMGVCVCVFVYVFFSFFLSFFLFPGHGRGHGIFVLLQGLSQVSLLLNPDIQHKLCAGSHCKWLLNVMLPPCAGFKLF